MRDTRRPEVAVKTCIGCHLGSPIQRVDHELLAAGHPPLRFELDTFGVDMPVHWVRREHNRGWFNGEAWVIGQLVATREAALHVTRQVRERGWPDFAAYDCQSCHHPLGKEAAELRGTRGRPPLDGSRRAGVDAIARVLAPERRETMRASAGNLAAAASEGAAGPALDRAVQAVRAETENLLQAVRGATLDDRRIVALMSAMLDLADPPSHLGVRAAEQATWTLGALADARTALAKSTGKPLDDAALRGVLKSLEAEVANSPYDAARVGKILATVRATLR
jgi:hypothetical protein